MWQFLKMTNNQARRLVPGVQLSILRDRARKTLLDQIVGAVGFARQVARIATQPGNFGLDEIDRPLHMSSLARAVVTAAAGTHPT